MKPFLEIIQCGFLSTIQDLGRSGYLQYGLAAGGAMDRYAAQLANILVGNNPHQTVLELTQSPHRFLVHRDCVVAFTGGGLQPTINASSLPLNQPLLLKAGSTLELLQPIAGFRLCMSVTGGFNADIFLNSYSTDLLSKKGGHKGRMLKKGDLLKIKEPLTNLQQHLLQLLQTGTEVNIKQKTGLADTSIIRVLTSAEWDLLPATSKKSIHKTNFTVSAQSSRMGYRLTSDTAWKTEINDIISSAVMPGTVQLTASGELIVLMADAQTVGGYPRILQVIKADLPVLSQKKPGDTIQFEIVSLQVAEQLYFRQQNTLEQLQQQVSKLFS